ncbi:MAG: molybdopterin-dependent oxidoreductase, partial [Hyphomicrobiaceae bacterium]
MDALGSAIRVDVRGREVMRILPRVNDAVNEEWISDKTRHVSDGLRTQRLDRPYVRENGKLRPATWQEAFNTIAARMENVNPDKVGVIAGDLAGAEEMYAARELFSKAGCRNFDCRQDGSRLGTQHGRASYLFNATIEGIDQADAILLVGTNPRLEAAVLNARIRRRWRHGGVRIGVVGAPADLTYDYELIGKGPDALASLADGKHAFAGVLAQAKNPLVIVGSGALNRDDSEAILALAARIATDAGKDKAAGWNTFNVLHHAASRVAGLDLGFLPAKGGRDLAAMLKGDMEVVYLLGADDFDVSKLGNAFVIYQGTHGDAGAHRADVILPAAAYTEKDATYVNTEGRAQQTSKAAFPPGDAKEDWAIIRALSDRLGAKLPFDSLQALRTQMIKATPSLGRLDRVEAEEGDAIARIASDARQKVSDRPFAPAITDFYFTNPIARASAVMAELSALRTGNARDQQAAE